MLDWIPVKSNRELLPFLPHATEMNGHGPEHILLVNKAASKPDELSTKSASILDLLRFGNARSSAQ